MEIDEINNVCTYLCFIFFFFNYFNYHKDAPKAINTKFQSILLAK